MFHHSYRGYILTNRGFHHGYFHKDNSIPIHKTSLFVIYPMKYHYSIPMIFPYKAGKPPTAPHPQVLLSRCANICGTPSRCGVGVPDAARHCRWVSNFGHDMIGEFVSVKLCRTCRFNVGKLENSWPSEVDLHGVDVQRSKMFRVYAAINPACFFS